MPEVVADLTHDLVGKEAVDEDSYTEKCAIAMVYLTEVRFRGMGIYHADGRTNTAGGCRGEKPVKLAAERGSVDARMRRYKPRCGDMFNSVSQWRSWFVLSFAFVNQFVFCRFL